MSRIDLVVLLLTQSVAAVASAGDLSFPSSAFGTAYQTTVTNEQLRNTPSWDDQEENPPVSARKAMALSRSALGTLVKARDDWRVKLDGITLAQHGDKWFWKAEYVWMPKSGGLGGLPPHMSIIVLMDETTVIPAVVDK